nr:SDR family oxidoreductase [Haloarcula rubripromontorii]
MSHPSEVPATRGRWRWNPKRQRSRSGTVSGSDVPVVGTGGTALITGASAGIGEALAREFAARGHDVVLVARSERKLERLAEDLETRGVTATPVVIDLDRPAAAETLYEEVTERGLAIDVLVNNVGVGTYGPFAESDLDAERTQVRLNVMLPVELTRLFVDGFDEGGAVINMGSVAGFQPGPNLAGYYASKAYINSFSEALAEEFRETPVDVTVVCPGPVDTEFQERAGMTDSTVGSVATNSPEAVATATYEGAAAGETVVIPRRSMRLIDRLVRVTPRWVVRRVAALVNRDR